MEDGGIRDTDIRATSSLNASASAIHGRLNHTGGYGGGALISSRIIMVQILSMRSLFKSNFPGPFELKA